MKKPLVFVPVVVPRVSWWADHAAPGARAGFMHAAHAQRAVYERHEALDAKRGARFAAGFPRTTAQQAQDAKKTS